MAITVALDFVDRTMDAMAPRPGRHQAVASHAALKAYVDRDVAVGVRSEDMEDARLVRDGRPDTRLRATVNLTEALGSEIVVHFEVDAPPVVTEDTRLLEKDSGKAEVALPQTSGTRFVASFAPRSPVRPRDDIEVVVDTERLHFFDQASGAAIRN